MFVVSSLGNQNWLFHYASVHPARACWRRVGRSSDLMLKWSVTPSRDCPVVFVTRLAFHSGGSRWGF